MSDVHSRVPKDPESENISPLVDDHESPGAQERTMTKEEKLDKSLADTFPTSDPIQPSRIDGPNN